MQNNFFNQSTQNSLWDTSLATLIFSGAMGTSHQFSLAGFAGDGFTNNFAWGALQLSVGNSLDLTQGSGNAFYVNYLDLLGGSAQLADLSAASGVSIYYNVNDAQNGYLEGKTFSLAGGGSLDPFSGPAGGTTGVPEPGPLGLYGMALIGLTAAGGGRLRRRIGESKS